MEIPLKKNNGSKCTKRIFIAYTKYQIDSQEVLLRYDLNWADIQEEELWNQTLAALADQLEWEISTAQSIFKKIDIRTNSLDDSVVVKFQINSYKHDNISEYPKDVFDELGKQLENGDWENKESAGVLYYTIALECNTCSDSDVYKPFAEQGTLFFL